MEAPELCDKLLFGKAENRRLRPRNVRSSAPRYKESTRQSVAPSAELAGEFKTDERAHAMAPKSVRFPMHRNHRVGKHLHKWLQVLEGRFTEPFSPAGQMHEGQVDLPGKMPLPRTVDVGASTGVRKAEQLQRLFMRRAYRFKPRRLWDLHPIHEPENRWGSKRQLVIDDHTVADHPSRKATMGLILAARRAGK